MSFKEIGLCRQPDCRDQDRELPLNPIEPTDPSSTLSCAPCIRRAARHIQRNTPCDICQAPYAWRNPKTRRNEYLCGNHHAASPEGVVLNKWFPRVSMPLNDRRPTCELRTNTAGTQCLGEVKWRSALSMMLCNKHAGKKYKPAYEGEEIPS